MLKKKKQLLIISLHADPAMPPGVSEWGGTHTYMRELLTELCNETYDITLITRKAYQQQNDIEIISVSCRIIRLFLGDFGIFDKRSLFQLHELTVKQTLDILKENNIKPDIIHSVYWNSGHLAMVLSKLWDIPYVHSVISNGHGRNQHGATGTAPERIRIEEKVFHNASFILCVAESEKAEICKYYNINSDKIVVAGQYVHPSFIFPAHDSYGNPRKSGINYKIESNYFSDYRNLHSKDYNWWNKQVFTYTGRLSLDKGLHYIVQAWFLLMKKYNELCPPLWIIGGNTIDIELIHSQLGISKEELHLLEKERKIVWWGYLDENSISSIYTKSLALITHSKYEPGGRVAVEAMCTGLPVLATPNGFALDIIQNWFNGFLIHYGDIQNMALRMEHFIKQPYLSNYMGYYASISSHDILSKWDFKKTHLIIYNTAIDTTKQMKSFSKPKICISECNNHHRKLNTYPFNMMLIDNSDILQIMNDNNIHNIISIQQVEILDSSSLFWEIKTKEKDYFVKIPYDRINFFPLWADLNEQPLVIRGSKRYDSEIGASQLNEIAALLGKDDLHHAIIREKYKSITVQPEQQLKLALDKIDLFYKKNGTDNNIDIRNAMKQLNSAIEQNNDYKIIDALYKELFIKFTPWQNYFMDYSLRIELHRWRHYYDILSCYQKDIISELFYSVYQKAVELSTFEKNLNMIINHGGCDYKNLIFTPKMVLLDNEKLHIGWAGIDYADLLLSFVSKNYEKESLEIWKNILHMIPQTYISHKILIGWLLLGICKEAISEVTYQNKISEKIYVRAQILLQLIINGISSCY